LTLVPVEEGATIEQPVWSAELEPNAFSGTIRVVVEHQQGEVTSGGNVTIASWADPPLEGEPGSSVRSACFGQTRISRCGSRTRDAPAQLSGNDSARRRGAARRGHARFSPSRSERSPDSCSE